MVKEEVKCNFFFLQRCEAILAHYSMIILPINKYNKDERALHLPQNALAMSLIVFVASVVVVFLLY